MILPFLGSVKKKLGKPKWLLGLNVWVSFFTVLDALRIRRKISKRTLSGLSPDISTPPV
jgi:hypothetical protein